MIAVFFIKRLKKMLSLLYNVLFKSNTTRQDDFHCYNQLVPKLDTSHLPFFRFFFLNLTTIFPVNYIFFTDASDMVSSQVRIPGGVTDYF